MYVMICTRPNMANVVSVTCYMTNPSKAHWQVLKRICSNTDRGLALNRGVNITLQVL